MAALSSKYGIDVSHYTEEELIDITNMMLFLSHRQEVKAQK